MRCPLLASISTWSFSEACLCRLTEPYDLKYSNTVLSEDPRNAATFLALAVERGWKGVVMAEQLVGAVYKINFQGFAPRMCYKTQSFLWYLRLRNWTRDWAEFRSAVLTAFQDQCRGRFLAGQFLQGWINGLRGSHYASFHRYITLFI